MMYKLLYKDKIIDEADKKSLLTEYKKEFMKNKNVKEKDFKIIKEQVVRYNFWVSKKELKLFLKKVGINKGGEYLRNIISKLNKNI